MLHLITSDRALADPSFASVAEGLLRAGRGRAALHLRGRATSARSLVEIAQRLRRVADEVGVCLLINDRVDVALAVGAHGVHLGARGMGVGDARRLLGPAPLVGASVHSLAEAVAAHDAGADYLIAGTLFPTPSHPGRPGAGTEWLRDLVALGLPVLGIGGITPERVRMVRAAGATGVAVMRGVWDAPAPDEAVAAYLAVLTQNPQRERDHQSADER